MTQDNPVQQMLQMNMKHSFKDVQLDKIEDDRLYDIHPFREDTQPNNDLRESIQRIGLLTPPILIEINKENYEIICGRQRIHCLRSLNRKSIHCHIVHEQCSAEAILNIILEDQFSSGPLTTIEQVCFIKICNQLLPDKKHQNLFFKSLLPDRITKGIKYLTSLAELDISVQSAIHYGMMSEKILTDILHFNSTDQKTLLSLIKFLNLKVNNQKKLILQLRDILKRDDTSLACFVDQEEVQKILSDTSDQSEKTARLLEYVEHVHRPLLTSYQKSFDLQIKALKLPDSVSIIPSSSFEKDDVTLCIRCRSLEVLKKRWGYIEPYLGN